VYFCIENQIYNNLIVIRKYKESVVLFFALIFLVFIKQYSSPNLITDSNKAENTFYQQNFINTPNHVTSLHTDRYSAHTFFIKKYLSNKSNFNQTYSFVNYSTSYKTLFNFSSYNQNTILKINCILRI
jgi:hypothetical protein